VNRIDPQTFASCFEDWIHALGPSRHILIAIDGQDLAPHARQTRGPQSAAHAQRLRDQRPSDAGANQRAREDQRDHGIPSCSIIWPRRNNSKVPSSPSTPWGCQVEIAAKIVEHKADFLLPLKGNQPTLEAEVEAYFETAPAEELVRKTTVEKGHGRRSETAARHSREL
jgi:hypothetical protein